jgi:hypothetical protein
MVSGLWSVVRCQWSVVQLSADFDILCHRYGFAAGCEAVAPPRRHGFTLYE